MARIDALSEEVLHIIFLSTLPSVIPTTATQSQSNIWSISPINLSLVCRSWNAIVASRSDLWASILVKHRECEVDIFNSTGIQDIIAMWMHNSSPSPLNVAAEFSILYDRTCVEDLMDLIHPHHDRLDKLHIKVFDVADLSADRPPIVIKLSSMTSSIILLDQSTSELTSCWPVVLDVTSVDSRSRLRTLDISTISLTWRLPEKRPLSFPSLERLNIGFDQRQSFDDVYAILSACTSVKFLKLQVDVRADTAPTDLFTLRARQPLPLTRLMHVNLGTSNIDTLIPIIEWISCPSLIDFTVRGRNAFTPKVLNAFADLFIRSKARLRSLVLSTPDSPPSAETARNELARVLERMLSTLDNLTHLSLEGLVLDRHLIESLTLSAADRVCPKLNLLELKCTKDEAFDVPLETFEEIIESRWNPEHILKGVLLRIPGVKNVKEESERLRALVTEGLTLTDQVFVLNTVDDVRIHRALHHDTA